MSLSSQNTFELTPGRRPIYSYPRFYHFSNKRLFNQMQNLELAYQSVETLLPPKAQ